MSQTTQVSRPILYSFRRCPYAMRARLAIAVSGQSVELREVVLRAKPAAMLAASPKATVPVLVQPGGEIVDESLDIMLWALRQRDPENWLAPDHGTVAQMMDLIRECDGAFKQKLDRYKYPQRFELSSGEDDRDAALPWLGHLDGTLSDTRFLFGDTASLADMAILPFIRQFAHTDKAWFEQYTGARLQRWLNGWLGSELFARVMEKYPPWEEGSEGIAFPPSRPGESSLGG